MKRLPGCPSYAARQVYSRPGPVEDADDRMQMRGVQHHATIEAQLADDANGDRFRERPQLLPRKTPSPWRPRSPMRMKPLQSDSRERILVGTARGGERGQVLRGARVDLTQRRQHLVPYPVAPIVRALVRRVA